MSEKHDDLMGKMMMGAFLKSMMKDDGGKEDIDHKSVQFDSSNGYIFRTTGDPKKGGPFSELLKTLKIKHSRTFFGVSPESWIGLKGEEGEEGDGFNFSLVQKTRDVAEVDIKLKIDLSDNESGERIAEIVGCLGRIVADYQIELAASENSPEVEAEKILQKFENILGIDSRGGDG